ncbi:MAG: substrate-binding domain-containing protein [Planctomycetota bacterium]
MADALRQRATNPLRQPGERFFSARQVAARFGVCYQTADRLLASMAEEGLVERRGQSGTYLAGAVVRARRPTLRMHPRARNPHGFGGKLRLTLTETLKNQGHDIRVRYVGPERLEPDELPIIWEQPGLADRCVAEARPAVLVNDRPRHGWGGSQIDCVGADDFAGGALAADVLSKVQPKGRRVILAGPRADRRSEERIAGFRSRSRATVVFAESWYRDAGRRAAERVLASRPTAVFAANDRLAEGLLIAQRTFGESPPLIIGYDDAPVASRLSLSTIALPWNAIANAVADRLRLRLAPPDPRTPIPASTITLHPAFIGRGTLAISPTRAPADDQAVNSLRQD